MAKLDFSGMTVRERLFEIGLLDEYTRARDAKDEARVRSLLRRVHVDQSSIEKNIGGMMAGSSPAVKLTDQG
jgi:DnaJ-domain-containing protein 1